MADALYGLLLTTCLIVRLLLVDVAIEVVLVIGFPGLRAHIAERFTAGTGHEVATHGPLNCLIAPGTDLGVL